MSTVTATPTSGKPVLLLDIDGVINSLLMKPPSMGWPMDAWNSVDYVDPDGAQWPLLWSSMVVEYLNALHESGRVEVRWHTTWQDQALGFAKVVGLPEDWAVAHAPEFTADQGSFARDQVLKRQPTWWKYPAARRVLTDEGRPLIWIDDDLFDKVTRVYRNGLGQLGKILLICPDGQTGLLPKHMRQIEEVLLFWESAQGAVTAS